MSGFIGGEGFGVPVTEIEWRSSGYLFGGMADRDSEERRLRRPLALDGVEATYEFTLNEAGMAWARRLAEDADRCQWVEDVKRRLGLIEPGDPVRQRVEQWKQDHAEPDPRIALCAQGRELDTALTLELYDQYVAEIRAHPWMVPGEIWLAAPPAPFAAGDDAFSLVPEPLPWPLSLGTIPCPGCTVPMTAGMFEPSCHYSFCTIAHPPMPPLNLGGLVQ